MLACWFQLRPCHCEEGRRLLVWGWLCLPLNHIPSLHPCSTDHPPATENNPFQTSVQAGVLMARQKVKYELSKEHILWYPGKVHKLILHILRLSIMKDAYLSQQNEIYSICIHWSIVHKLVIASLVTTHIFVGYHCVIFHEYLII